MARAFVMKKSEIQISAVGEGTARRWSTAAMFAPLKQQKLKWATGSITACFETYSMWSILWNRLHICKSFKSCSTKSCYTPPTRPRSALGETGLLWCATPCANISAGWNCEPLKSATARATCDSRQPTRKRGVGNRRPRGRKNSPRPDSPRRGSALPICRARQKTAGPRAHAQQRHCLSIHGHGRARYFHHSRSAIRSRAE